jgi:hypothetical protein
MNDEALPNQDERRRIIERVRRQLEEACLLNERLNQLQLESMNVFGFVNDDILVSSAVAQMSKASSIRNKAA